jgi:hypothetical protein
MDTEYEAQLREELRTTRRLLHERRMQLAKAGSYADPSIKIAAEDLEREVWRLEDRLGIDRPQPATRRPAARYETQPEPEPVFQERVVGRQTAARQHDIDHQMNLLKIHRANLAHYRAQARAFGGIDFAPPMTRNGMNEQRDSIARIKQALGRLGVEIDDLPGDE